MNLKKTIFSLLLLLLVTGANTLIAQEKLTKLPDNTFNFIIGNDLGRNGYYDQKHIAQKMGELAEEIDIEFVAALGDIHHFEGVASVNDPLWMTNYELIYAHPELMIDWFPILGNHEYRGNTQAIFDYKNISRRWSAQGRYYAQSYELENGASLKLIYIDTTPLIEKYRNESNTYKDACKQDVDTQLKWLDSTLRVSKETWKIVMGHHPIYAQTPKQESERVDLQKRVDPLLRTYGVDFYICGHIHNFQHIKKEKGPDYIVNTSGSLSRKVSPIAGTLFCSPLTGFSVVSASPENLKLYMLDKDGHILHTIVRKK